MMRQLLEMNNVIQHQQKRRHMHMVSVDWNHSSSSFSNPEEIISTFQKKENM